MNTTFRAALMAALLLVPVCARAQMYIQESELYGDGPAASGGRIEGDLDLDTLKSREVILPEGPTGAGHRWTVNYRFFRTKTTYPDYAAYARIDVLSRDGECLDRVWQRDFKGEVTGSFQFLGEDSPEARPHRLRVTFSQYVSFPFHYEIEYGAAACKGANVGGPVRERPVYMATGTQAAPSWICGDIRLEEGHRALLFHVKPGAELRTIFKPSTGWRNIGGMRFRVYDRSHRLLRNFTTLTSVGSQVDAQVYRNTSAEAAWIIVQLGEYYRCDHKLGFYSPQGASPAEGETIPMAAIEHLDPYLEAATTRAADVLPVGATGRWELAGSGAMVRLRVHGLKVPMLEGGGIGHVSVTVYSKAGVKLISRLIGTDMTGHCPAETFYELDFSNVDSDSPGAVEVKTAYQPAAITVEATRYGRK